MHGSFWRLGWRALWRDVRSGDLRLLLLAITLAVAALTAVAFFADRMQGGLQRDARQLLGGDAVVASDNPPPNIFAEQAAELGLRSALSLTFPTMARSTDEQGGQAKLVALKIVEPGYPLRGNVQIAPNADAPGSVTRAVPDPGQVWVDSALLDALDLQVGDALLLGESQLTIGAVLKIEPDRGAGFMNFAPRVMMHRVDIESTGLVQPASRLTYRLAVAGEDAAVARFVEWAQSQNQQERVRGLRIESLEGGRPEMSQTLGRAEKFLSLVALLAALLSAVAVALAARSFATRHLDDCAMLRVLGLSQRSIAASYSFEFVCIGLFASIIGVTIGYVVHHVFVWLLAGLVQSSLPAAGWYPIGLGLGVGMTLLLAFGLPPVLQLAQVPPLRVIRRDMGGLRPASVAVLGVGIGGFAALLLAASNDLKMGWIAVGGFGAAVLVFAAVSALAVKLLRWSVNEATAPRWLVLATRQVAARPAYTVVQVSALSIGLLALVLLVLLRTDLISSWRNATPPDAPNRFVINIMPEQADAFRDILAQSGVSKVDFYPMMRGRLLRINDREVSPDDYAEDRAKRLVDREFNLSYAAQAPAQNRISAGTWVADEPGSISVEDGLAKTLGLKLGDTLVFSMGGMEVASRITSLRSVDWSSMRLNFFVMYPVAQMPGVPTTYVAAYQAPNTKGFDNALLRQFPNVTNVDLTSTINQVQQVLNQVIRAVEFLFVFTLAAGVIVLLAAVMATRDKRAKDFAIMRAVGARNTLLRQVQRAELAGVGLLAGVLASLTAVLIGWLLARYVFEFTWVASVWVPILGALAGAVLAWLAGWLALRGILQRPVMQTLGRAPD
jgi:putative ABC transport system permease protein